MAGAEPCGTFADVITVGICTTSKFAAVTVPSECRSLSFHRLSGAPVMNMGLPLSAMMRPYFFIALRITWLLVEKVETLNVDFSRRRRPIGTGEVLLLPAQCVAGLTNADSEAGSVRRMA